MDAEEIDTNCYVLKKMVISRVGGIFFLEEDSLLIMSVKSLKILHVTHKNREYNVDYQGLVIGEIGRCLRAQTFKLVVKKSSGDVIHSIEIMVNNTVL